MTDERSTLEQVVKRSRTRRDVGGHARAAKISPEERSEIARSAAQARWGTARRLDVADGDHEAIPVEAVESEPEVPADFPMPEAKYRGSLRLLDIEVPCYVLSDGRRVIGRTSATEMLTSIKGGGDFEKYIGVTPFRPFVNVEHVSSRMVPFRLPEVEGLERNVRGLPADELIEVCRGLVAALEASTRPDSGVRLTSRQMDMALRASMFLAACAKVGLEAMIDEATGYQYERAEDALQVKLRAYLLEDMRPWEKTFPDELWVEFGRLTNWSGSVTKRPKYWGHLVNELVYQYLDEDVARWLKENAPKPRHGQNYHQWLTGQYGLQKLIEHIYKLIGIAKTCQSMIELKDKMAELYGKHPVQVRMYFSNNPSPSSRANRAGQP
jgi:hypothetical protein